ncbi:hypothetical protein F4779DRAFT_569791 [Xylariaceae sp. FL0662B]|nr:hypothetical protein F4779DRAFT_569791 [Xylariaceae sp. FL0662B]
MDSDPDGSFLHWLHYIRAYEALDQTPQQISTSSRSNASNETENHAGFDRLDGDVSPVSRADGHRRASSTQDEYPQLTWLEPMSHDDEEYTESFQPVTTDYNISLPLTSTNTLAVDHSSDEYLDNFPEEVEPPAERLQSWLPLYLRRIMFIAFAVLFGAMIVALEVLFAISEQHQGLTESYASLRYLWTYGPTALLTLIHAFWNRVDYEAKVAAPWLKGDPIITSRDALLLDYIDMFPLVVPFRALKHRDYPVAASSTISLLFTILIVLSTGLFTLSPVEIGDDSVPISLKSQFVDDPSRLTNPSVLPFYGMHGLVDENLTYPDGCSEQFAYQSFNSSLPRVSELHATVDGISLGLDCAQADVKGARLTQMIWTEFARYAWDSYLYLEYGGCNSTISFDTNLMAPLEPYRPFKNNTDTLFTQRNVLLLPLEGLTPGECGSTGQDHKRLVFISVELDYKLVKETKTTYANASAVMLEFEVIDIRSTSLNCAPNYGIVLVDVTQNATGVNNVSRHGEAPPRTFSDIHPWDIIQAHIESFQNFWQDRDSFSIANATIDSLASPVLKICGNSCSQFSSLLNATLLEDLLIRYYQQYAAFLLQQSLLQPVDTASTAVASRIVDRLLVQPAGCQWMAGIMALAMIILVGLSLRPPKMMPRSIEPGSILATAALAGHLTVSRFPHTLGATDTKTLEREMNNWSDSTHMEPHSSVTGDLADSRFPSNATTNRQDVNGLAESTESQSTRSLKPVSPFALRPIFRIIIYSLIVACVAILEVMLQRSVRYQGLGDVQDETYLHYVWTVLPATILSLLALFFSSVDSQTRLLAPYHSLTRVASTGSSLDLDLLRPLMPQAIYREFRTRSFAPLATSAAALVSSLFAISIGSLYQLKIMPTSSPVEIRTTSTFSTSSDSMPDTSIVTSLILESNLSYTPLVYENLVFPAFSLEGFTTTNASQASDNSSTTINATIPALRPGLSCHLYPDSDISASFFHNQTIDPHGIQPLLSDGLAINITGESCPGRWFPNTLMLLPNSTATFAMDLPTEGFFATASNTKTHAASGCSYFLYVWGSFSSLTGPPSIAASALGCNVTTEAIDVVAPFLGPQLHLDPSNPPQPDESTVQLIPVQMNFPNGGLSTMADVFPDTLYDFLASLPPGRNDTVFDPFFEQLVTSRYAIPISTIGDPSQAAAVRDAIVFQHGVIAAQYYSANFRVSVEVPENGTNGSAQAIFPSLSNSSSDSNTGVYPGTAVDPYGRRRVVQDPASTRVVEALLLATLALSMLGWGLGPRKAVLPRSPSSVASVLALLAGGDVLEYMYKDGDAQWESLEDARLVFPEDCGFWMGWGPPGISKEENERRFGIWMVKNQGGQGVL